MMCLQYRERINNKKVYKIVKFNLDQLHYSSTAWRLINWSSIKLISIISNYIVIYLFAIYNIYKANSA